MHGIIQTTLESAHNGLKYRHQPNMKKYAYICLADKTNNSHVNEILLYLYRFIH